MEAEASNQWRFAQCFGDKGEVDEITEGTWLAATSLCSCWHGLVLAQPHALVGAMPNADGAADIISTVEFDHTGNYLATGDKGGRVVLFERNESVRLSHLHPASSCRLSGP